MPASSLTFPAGSLRRNAGFAKQVRGFANRAWALPGFPMLPVTGAAATVLMAVVGAFGTGAMPLGSRAAFWAVLIGGNVVIWQAWFVWRVRSPADWPRAAMIGAVVINLPLPFEIALALRLFGIAQPPDLPRVWIEALAISAVIFAVLIVARGRRPAVPPVAAIRLGGLLARAGVAAPGALLAIRAEDHYCRLFLDGGRDLLLHHRFGDALAEVAGFDGAQVHRGVWIADRGVTAAAREGRAWRLILPGGTALPVSPRFVATARARGWLARAKTVAIAALPG